MLRGKAGQIKHVTPMLLAIWEEGMGADPDELELTVSMALKATIISKKINAKIIRCHYFSRGINAPAIADYYFSKEISPRHRKHVFV